MNGRDAEYWHQFDMQWKEAVNTVHIPKPEKWDTFPDQKFGSHSKPGKLSHIPRPRIWVTFPNQGNRATFPDQEFGSHSQTRKPHSQTKNLGHIPKPGTESHSQSKNLCHIPKPESHIPKPELHFQTRDATYPLHCCSAEGRHERSHPFPNTSRMDVHHRGCYQGSTEVVNRSQQK